MSFLMKLIKKTDTSVKGSIDAFPQMVETAAAFFMILAVIPGIDVNLDFVNATTAFLAIGIFRLLPVWWKYYKTDIKGVFSKSSLYCGLIVGIIAMVGLRDIQSAMFLFAICFSYQFFNKET